MRKDEQQFADYLIQSFPGTSVVGATPQEDRIQHFDLIHVWPNKSKSRIEFKGLKSYQKNGPIMTDMVWIEWQGNYGHPGWIRADADIIAFEFPTQYMLVTRKPLEILVSEFVDWGARQRKPHLRRDANTYKCYGGRPSINPDEPPRDDKVCLVPVAHIERLKPRPFVLTKGVTL